MPAVLGDSEIAKRLKSLKGWKRKGKFITKTYEFNEFMEGVSFINAVARIAEREEHHPDIGVRYTSVTLSIQTHSAGGVTAWDFGLAEKIESYLARKGRVRNAKL